MYNYTRSIAHAAEGVGHDVELLFVEWNPPVDEAPMSDALDWPNTPENVEIRFVEVPPRLHRQQEGADDMPVFEYIGKNVGVRRAADGPVVVTNPDLVYGERLVRETPKLSTDDCFYRANRYDVDTVPDRHLEGRELTDFCREHTYAVQNRSETVKPGPAADEWLKRYGEYLRDATLDTLVSLTPGRDNGSRFDPPELFTHVAGDFVLADRQRWIELRGFPETEFNWGVDRLMVLNMANSGLEQRVLGDDYRLYHQEHENMHAQRPQPDLDEVLSDKVGDDPRPVWQPNGDDWGLASEDLLNRSV